MWITTGNLNDPIEVSQSPRAGKLKLRIGKERPGKTRYAHLSPTEARKVAYALLSAAEETEERSGSN